MFDYSGSFEGYQKQLNEAGVDYDITNLCGCTRSEIESFVYSKTHFKCDSCGRITLKVRDKIGKASNWLCQDCLNKVKEN